jgi:acetyltransferase-like isoleucine patch superfamily enzyme
VWGAICRTPLIGRPHRSAVSACQLEKRTWRTTVGKRISSGASLNRILHALARIPPGATSLRPALHRLRGVKIGEGVFIGEDVYLQNEYPEAVEIGSGTEIGLRSVLIGHFRGPGRIVIGKDVWVGACTFISSASGRTLTIGDGAVIGACSVITTDVPAKAVVKPPEPLRVGTANLPLPKARSYGHFLLGLRPERGVGRARQENGPGGRAPKEN